MSEVQASRRAQLLLVAAAVVFALMTLAAKLASERIGGEQVALLRFAVGALPILFIPAYRQSSVQIQRWDLLFYRGFFGGLAVWLFFLAIEHIPVGVATLLNYTSPIFSVLFAAIFLGEKAQPRILIPLATAIAGVFLVVRGQGHGVELFAGFGPFELAGLASAICGGAAVTAIRAARRSESSWSIYASFTLFGLLINLPMGLLNWVHPTVRDGFWLVVVGLTSFVAQLLMTFAFRWVDNLRAGVIAQLTVVLSLIFGALVFGDQLTAQQLCGSVLTLGSVIAVIALGSPTTAGDEAVHDSAPGPAK